MAKDRGLTIALTGAAGYLASRLIGELEQDERVGRILGFDVHEPRIHSSKLVFDPVDIRNVALESRLKGVDVLIHLAFIMDPIHNEAEMRDVNVNGSQNVFKCAGRAGVGRVIYTSSGVAYGAHPDNDVPLTESSPLRANLDFNYPAHKLEVEYVVKEIRDEFPEMKIAVLRPTIVFGPHVDNAWSHMIELPVLLGVQGYNPPMQFVHEDDVAGALLFAVFNDLDGAYNLCPRDWLEYEQIVDLVGKRRVDLPEPMAFTVAEKMWQMGMAEAPAGMLHYVMHPWVMSPDKLEAAGFKCEHSSYDAFTATVAKTKDSLRLGKTRVARSDLRKGLLTGVGVAGGVVAWRTVRGLRARRS